MDDKEVINRLVTAALTAFGVAATTAILLSVFQEDVKRPDSVITTTPPRGGPDPFPISRGIPKVGDASALFPDFIAGLTVLATKARDASSHGLGWFDNMGHPILMLSNSEHSKLILNKITAHALWGGIQPASEAFFGKSVLFVLEGDEWKRLRYLLRDSFKMQSLDRLSRDVTSSAVTLANRLGEFVDQEVDLNVGFGLYHLAAVGKSSYDFDMNVMQNFPNHSPVSSAFEYLLSELPRRSFHPDQAVREDYVSGNEDNLKWHKASKTVRDMVQVTIVQRLREGGKAPKRGDLLDSMIASYRANASSATLLNGDIEQQAQLLTDALGDNLVEVFFAGYGTSSVAMAVGLYHLAKDRALMAQAHAEVDSVLSGDMKFDQEALTAKKFPFLCRVFSEALRVVPPAPLVSRITTEPLVVEGMTIPSGTVVWFPASFFHSDAKAWGSTVNEFDPSRWEKPLPSPSSFLPFSGGARDCIGKHFAELESVVVLAVLLKTYDFDVAPGFVLGPVFTGFGTRAGNANTSQVECKLVPRRRTNTSAFMYDWTPSKTALGGRKNSNPLLQGVDEYEGFEVLPNPPKF
ncbi:hypothetical protein BASA81_006498 [Batrachochytrium salamandrivorans]|nr:hypothetical protein BASA81_006498 [Batrachochytrium salamandrivorans]